MPLSQKWLFRYSNAMNNLSCKIPVIAAALCFFACATGTLNIPYELSPSELIQRAQEASDRNRYNYALQYYQALLERNSTNIDLVCTAEYEIAFIHYKQKKYTQARTEFNNLLMRYDMPNGEMLPQQFKLLANKVLERISEKEKPTSFFSRNT
jgi:tetratricopeptide (TPR) repeat protein